MTHLLRMEYGKLLRQKYIYFFTFGFIVVFFFFGLIMSMFPDGLFFDPTGKTGAGFPEYMIIYYASYPAPIFMALLTAFTINQERQSKTFMQPLLHGVTRRRLLLVKCLSLCLTAFIITIILGSCSYLWGRFFWNAADFNSGAMLKYAMVALWLSVMEIGFVAISLFSPNSAVTIIASVAVIVSLKMTGGRLMPYYPDAYENMPLPYSVIGLYTGVALLTAVLLYILAHIRISKMEFR